MAKNPVTRILITGAYGFIGSYVTASLLRSGYQITCAVRDIVRGKLKFPICHVIYCNFNNDVTTKTWVSRLKDIDVVINIVGLLQSSRKNDINNVHSKSTIALFKACRLVEAVKKIIHISALGIDNENLTAYSRTKKQADNYLKTINDIDWVILQPSLVYASGSYGGTSLLRGLAALPLIPLIGEGNQKFQPVHVQDLSKVIIKLVEKKSKTQAIIKVAGPQVVTVKEILKSFRGWLGLKPTSFIRIPKFFVRCTARFGDILGWSPLNSTSVAMLEKDNTANISKMQRITGVNPISFNLGLATEPLTIQSLWHARLYFLKPFLRIFMGIFWLFSGFNCIFLAKAVTIKYFMVLGFNNTSSLACLYIGSFIDIIIGLCLLFRVKVVITSIFLIIMVIAYSVILSFLDPQLWLHPMGPLAKNIPVILSALMLIAIERDK